MFVDDTMEDKSAAGSMFVGGEAHESHGNDCLLLIYERPCLELRAD
jgi:hypothetical protein